MSDMRLCIHCGKQINLKKDNWASQEIWRRHQYVCFDDWEKYPGLYSQFLLLGEKEV